MIPEHLRIAVLPTGPFSVNISTTGNVTITDGFEVGLLHILTRGLQMLYTLRVPSDGTWGTPGDNGNWSGLMGMVQRNEVDMAIGSIFVSEARTSVVSFSYPYTWQDITFATRTPGLQPKGMAFTWPFGYSVWASLGLSVFVMLLAFRYLMYKSHPFDKLVFHVLGILLRQSTLLRSHRVGDMVLCGSWILGCFFLSYGYTAVLLSFLTVPLSEYPLRTVSELSRAVASGKYMCASAKGSNVLESMLESKEESVQTMGRYISKNKWQLDYQSDREVVDFLNEGKTAVITTRERMKFQFQDQFYISKDALFSSQLAVAMNKQFAYKNRLNKVIKAISAFGIYQKTIDDYLYKKKIASKASEASNYHIKQLTLNDLYGAFIFLGSGYVFAILVFTFELLHAKISMYSEIKKVKCNERYTQCTLPHTPFQGHFKTLYSSLK